MRGAATIANSAATNRPLSAISAPMMTTARRLSTIDLRLFDRRHDERGGHASLEPLDLYLHASDVQALTLLRQPLHGPDDMASHRVRLAPPAPSEPLGGVCQRQLPREPKAAVRKGVDHIRAPLELVSDLAEEFG